MTPLAASAHPPVGEHVMCSRLVMCSRRVLAS
jgi:hypothetical protein